MCLYQKLRKAKPETSGQDRSISRYTLPPHTTKRRTTTHLKTKNNQNCQKIKLYGSPTTKELKKKHSSRQVGGVGTGGQGGEDSWQGSSWRTGVAKWWLVEWLVSYLHADDWEEQLGSKTDCATKGPSEGK